MSLTEKRLAACHRRRMKTLKLLIEDLSPCWEGLDGGIVMAYEELYRAADYVIEQLDYAQYEKEKGRED
ncbi:hypothetical protein [Photorhabdus sp. RM71S]|uniref:hypothetical protein n=1 Tax=Photorhabdus sp. RM71S TaxID=3342824 RepID=UPI0036DEFEDE